MRPHELPEQNVRIAEEQEEYMTLPAFATKKSFTFGFELDDTELQKLQETGILYIELLHGGHFTMTPMRISVDKKDLIEPEYLKTDG